MVDPTPEQIRWNQLRKQHLLDEKALDFYDLVKTQLGLHSTDYWTPYFSVWARIGDYDVEKMFESINSGMKLVRTHAFRTTLHVIHVDNLPLILAATGPALFRASRTDKFRKMDQLSDQEIEHLLNRVKETLHDGPLQMSELKRAAPDIERHMRSALVMLMARGEVVRAKASHARNNLTSYALMDKWVDGFRMKQLNEQEAIDELIERHIELFGPVSIDDIAWWLRITKTAVKNSIERIGQTVVNVKLPNQEKHMMRSDYEIAASLEVPDKDVVWFLPYEDHFLKAFIDRTSFIREEIQPKLFPADRRHFWPSNPNAPRVMPSPGLRATGEVRPSIWLNGEVVGRWEIDDKGGQKKIVTSIYRKEAGNHQEILEQSRKHLESFVNDSLLPISGG
ncbi:MAG: winged helix DNA-binding domain-containing protein [Candidatus Odinarchaeota archaeon]